MSNKNQGRGEGDFTVSGERPKIHCIPGRGFYGFPKKSGHYPVAKAEQPKKSGKESSAFSVGI